MAKILVVEDESTTAQMICHFLVQLEHQVASIVGDGLQSIQLASETHPDLVLMDIHLSGEIDGITAADRIYRQFQIPIIYISAATEDEILKRATSTSAFGYLVKPFNQLQLQVAINVALQRHCLEKQLEQANQRLTTTLTSIGDGAIATDQAGLITFMNPVAERLTGWQLTDALGSSVSQILNLIHADTHEQIENPVMQAMQAGMQVNMPEQCLLRTKDGLDRRVGDSATPIRNSSGKITGGVLVFQDITQRHQAAQNLRLQAEREQLLGAIAERIRQSLNLNDILDTAVNEIHQLLQTDRVVIYRFETNWSGFVIVEALTPGWVSMAGREILDPYLATEKCLLPFARGAVSRIENIDTAGWEPCHVELLEQFQVKANLAIPILQGEALWGLLVVQQCSAPRQWQDWEVSFLKRLATSLSIALQQSQLYQQTQLQAQREQALCKLIQTVRNSLDLQTIFNAAVFEIGSLVQVDQADVFQYLEIQNSWVCLASHCHDLERSQHTVGSEMSDINTSHMALLKQFEIVRLDNATRLENPLNQTAETFLGAWLAVPIQIGDRLWGTIQLVNHDPAFIWQDWQVELISTVADQLAIAIQQSELYTEVQRLNFALESQVLERTTALQRALSFESLLKCITDQVRDSLDENQILQTAVEALGQGLKVKCCSAGLYNSTLTTFTVTHEYLVSLPPAQGQTFAMADQCSDDFYQQLFRQQCIQFCFSAENSVRPGVGRQSILACPIFDDQGVLGDLWLFRPSQTVFSEVEIRLVQLVANQCAIALRQSRLYQAAQAQVHELEHLNYLKDDFLSTISHELRTPMSSIKMAVQMVKIALDPLGILNDATSSVSRYFQILQTECQREINLIDDLLNLSRLNADTEPLVLSTVTPQIWINHAIEPFYERINTQEQILEIDIPKNLPCFITDLSCLGRVLSELLDNACKYTATGGTIGVFAHLTSKGLCLGVRNTGTIPADELPRIFDRFYRVPRNDPWRYSGIGLGLALVKQLVAHIGADLQVESNTDQTTFMVTFPQSSLISSS
ncbi:GAF domain-containing protein [Phormidium sp. CLA17]|uniref:GAF domain-containing protein n=1 Tax=Leptolyngbya sp. Cla-17 TaxID=2803751 RepID=UPI001492D155|nr:GAF domain-containing protein [Leptolyngbya sp. Cla-17]MBM0740651.1 GAF domain-containing protein [Leptolyngbya sp. Cla-17]